MALDFAPLVEALDEMLVLHRELVALGGEKPEVIIAGDTDRLSAIVQREMRLMQQSAAADKRRAAAAEALAKQGGLGPGQVTITRLRQWAVDPVVRARLLAQGDELAKLLTGQKEANERTKALLEAHIEYTDMMLNLMVGPEDPLNNIYGAQGLGDKNRRQTPGLFDKQV